MLPVKSIRQERKMKTILLILLNCLRTVIYYSFFLILGTLAFHATKSLLTTHSKPIVEGRPPRILCYINTIPQTYFTKAIHVNRTWGHRCSKILFFGSKTEPTIPVIDLNLTKPESRMHLWSKMRKILRNVYAYRNDYDYFFKCDDDTYLFFENLAVELSRFDPNQPFMMGHRFLRFLDVGYFSGGAGYVLSRAALIRIVENAIDKHPSCPTYDEDKEDVKMSICGSAVGVKLYDAIDRLGKNKFQWVAPEDFFHKTKLPQIDYTLKQNKMLRQLPVSVNPISFHYVKAEIMYLMDYCVYFARIFH